MKKDRKGFVGLTVRFTGIKLAAKQLDISENHLRYVLRGKRQSATLLARVRERFPALLGMTERQEVKP